MYVVGSYSFVECFDKLCEVGVMLFDVDGYDLLFVVGCLGWFVCRLILELYN